MKKTETRKQAFTLAEVLITLSIIGVVAALTIPTLIQRTGNEELVSRLLKAYSTFSQATEAIMSEQGNPKTWASDADMVYNLYKKNLRNSKDCGSTSGCFTQTKINRLDTKKPYSVSNWDSSTYRKLILSDGMQVIFEHVFSANCTGTQYTGGTKNYCTYFHVDVNGSKEPNTFGRDVFTFVLKADGLYPCGCDYDSCEGTDGWGCTCKVIREGKMDY